MRIALALVPEAGPASGPDLTRYLLVCALLIVSLIALAWVFRRFVAGRLRSRAAKRSLQVLDVLPLSGKQKLVVVRCYDRSFLLGLGEKEVRSIAELDVEQESAPEGLFTREVPPRPFGSALEDRLAASAPAGPTRGAAPRPESLGSGREGVLA